MGQVLIEVKRDLRAAGVLGDATEQLQGYLNQRAADRQQRYVGVLTDGLEWRAFHQSPDGSLRQVADLLLHPTEPDVDRLCGWLGAILATAGGVRPTASEVAARLGVDSPGFALDRAALEDLWSETRSAPEAELKRDLWGRMLTAAYGTPFTDDPAAHDGLFLEHTYVVLVATMVAHAVLGLPVVTEDPASVLHGDAFEQAAVHGVAGADFFDWVLDCSNGPPFVRRLARRVCQFDWAWPEHDVLKHLYQSIISGEARKGLGEYYTPDWLADHIVQAAVTDPLEQRVLDPACGSGTFLFHAVRAYLEAAKDAGVSNADALSGVADHVSGLDVHPVAVVLARVTYLLAIGSERLNQRRRDLTVPVYLGDSVRWQLDHDLLSKAGVTISTGGDDDFFPRELYFPSGVLRDPARFDRLVGELAALASNRDRGSAVPPLGSLFEKYEIHEPDAAYVQETFANLCSLHDEHRDRVWGYYITNLVRPLWLSQTKVDILIGNPPWLAYRFMTRRMQEIFKARSKSKGLWVGGRVATSQDLSAYFLSQCAELYLQPGGRFALVMPRAVLSRPAYAGFRTGQWEGAGSRIFASFHTPLDLDEVRPPPFPVPSCVVFGDVMAFDPDRDLDSPPVPLQSKTTVLAGTIPDAAMASWAEAREYLEMSSGNVEPDPGIQSAWGERFWQGATIVPRALHIVGEVHDTSSLGLPEGRVRVRSSRTKQEKEPWRYLQDRSAVIEERFVFRLFLANCVLPFRLRDPALATLPVQAGVVLTGPALQQSPLFAAWWSQGEEVWEKLRSKKTSMTLTERIDYHRGLSQQMPIPPIRVVYNKSGSILAAATLLDDRAVADETLYWAQCDSLDEARYLTAILNAPIVTALTAPLQSKGLYGTRDFALYVWRLPIPTFDGSPLHRRLARLAGEAEEVAAAVAIPSEMDQKAARTRVRRALDAASVSRVLDSLVLELLRRQVAASD